jgi:GNAT superfamily N-acetyltransferase
LDNERYRVLNCSEVGAQKLDAFLRCCFSPKKCDFLQVHGEWRHRGNENRFVILNTKNDELIGYFASIPTEILIRGDVEKALWWMDLFILPEYRGKGIQRVTDAAAKKRVELQVGFPNHLAAKIHKKHGWGVRTDYRVMMLPLKASRIPHVKGLGFSRRVLALFFEALLYPTINIYRLIHNHSSQSSVKRLFNPSESVLAKAFAKHPSKYITTNRNESYIKWRYLERPNVFYYDFFASGLEDEPDIVMVTRSFEHSGVKITRIVDVFGAIDDHSKLSGLIKHVICHALEKHSVYITIMATPKTLISFLKRHGFIFSFNSRFRWFSSNKLNMKAIERGICYWCLADSDNDSLE